MAPSFTRAIFLPSSLSSTDTPPPTALFLIREFAHSPAPPPAPAALQKSMSALVSALLALAFDQLWLPLQQEVAANAAFLYGNADTEDELALCPGKSPEQDPDIDTMCNTNSTNSNNCSSSKKQQQRNARRKKQSPAPKLKSAPRVEIAKTNAESLSSDLHSDASTCGSSDEEDHEDTEDIGERERKLMLARAQQVKSITLQQQQSRVVKRVASRKKSAAAPVAATPAHKQLRPESSYPDVCAPLRLRNITNTLWHWSVFSGFQVDRFPLDLLQHLDCDTVEDDEEAWEGTDLRDRLLQMLDGDEEV